ncbi:MAG: DUF805 domain-containing protein, partial [Acidobacteria bacterium]|nr:DUF805 domain-containing protein [Acidobacteriota bacterium]
MPKWVVFKDWPFNRTKNIKNAIREEIMNPTEEQRQLNADVNPRRSGMLSSIFWLLLSIKGRINRKGFWCSFSALIILLATSSTLGNLGFGAYVVAVLLASWVYTAMMVRRLHDLGRSGWWFFLLTALPGGCSAVIDAGDRAEGAM